MNKKKLYSMAMTATMSFAGFSLSFGAFAASSAEEELNEYLTSLGVQDKVSWERVEGKSLSKAKIYGLTYVNEEGADDEQKYLIKEVVFDEYEASDERSSVKVKYKGVTDENGAHVLLSDSLESKEHFKNLGYEKLDDIEVKLNYVMESAQGSLEGEVDVDQKDVLSANFNFKTEGLDMLVDQLSSLDIATLDPNLIVVSALATKIHKINLNLKDDGYNKRLVENEPERVADIEEQYQNCVEAVGELGVKQLEDGCASVRDYFLNKKNKLHISMNPAKPFSVGEYLPMFMLLESTGPEAAQKLIDKIINEINLKISN